MKKRLIDANALIEEAVKANIRMPYDKVAVFDLIEKAPTVDAVEVVRCKDCSYNVIETKRYIICDRHGGVEFPVDGFCSYGERKTNE